MKNENSNNFKHELFLGLFNKHYGEDKVSLNDLVNRTNLVKAKLDNDNETLADLREGPFSTTTLDDAVEKLAFELQNDASLYGAYKAELMRCMIQEAQDNKHFKVEGKLSQPFREYAKKVAQMFLDSLINDALRNKDRNEKREQERKPKELEV